MGDSGVVSIKIPRRILDEMRESKGEVDWPEELRSFIVSRLKKRGSERALKETERLLSGLPVLPHGSVSGTVREDRDRH
jgi:hypothetical protein